MNNDWAKIHKFYKKGKSVMNFAAKSCTFAAAKNQGVNVFNCKPISDKKHEENASKT